MKRLSNDVFLNIKASVVLMAATTISAARRRKSFLRFIAVTPFFFGRRTVAAEPVISDRRAVKGHCRSVFGDGNRFFRMCYTYTQYRGLAKVTNWVKLKFAAMNLKKLATRKWKGILFSGFRVFLRYMRPKPGCA